MRARIEDGVAGLVQADTALARRGRLPDMLCPLGPDRYEFWRRRLEEFLLVAVGKNAVSDRLLQHVGPAAPAVIRAHGEPDLAHGFDGLVAVATLLNHQQSDLLETWLL